MKKSLSLYLIIFTASLLIFSGTAYSSVLFDFEDAPYLGSSAQIEAYMEGLYPGDITVEHAIIGGILSPLIGDKFIRNANICGGGEDWFSITFKDPYPITSVAFDWGVILNPIHLYADDEPVFDSSYYGWNSGTENITFTSPVNELRFCNSGLGNVAIDNLEVSPVPEPASMLLFGIGALGFGITRKRRKF